MCDYRVVYADYEREMQRYQDEKRKYKLYLRLLNWYHENVKNQYLGEC